MRSLPGIKRTLYTRTTRLSRLKGRYFLVGDLGSLAVNTTEGAGGCQQVFVVSRYRCANEEPI